MRLLGRILPVAVGAAVVVAVGGYVVTGKQQSEQKQKRARAFRISPRRCSPRARTVADVPIYLDAVGNTRALNTVTVRAQVGGQIVKVALQRRPGRAERGYVLAEIDPRTYQAQYDQADRQEGAGRGDARQCARSTSIATRGSPRSNSGSKQQADTQRALVAQLEAQVQGDQAAIDNTRTMLSYTKIVAPIDGRTGLRLVDEGNLVQANDTTGIVTITQIQPISVLFNLPQQQFPQVNKAFAKGPLRVDAIAGDGRTVDRSRHPAGDRQPDGSDHRHDPHEGGVSQRQPAALAGAVRQYPRAGRYAEAGRDGADRRRAARAAGHVRLRGRRREQGRGAADHDRAAGRYARGDLGRREGAGAGGHHRLHAPVERHARARAGGRGRAAGCGAERATAEGAPTERRRKREGGGSVENTDGKQWRRSETAPGHAERQAMNVSAPFITRPIATSLLGVAVMFGGLLGYLWLPVSALPQVDFPDHPGDDAASGRVPDTMVSLVTAPLERQFGQIPSLSTMTSSSSYGISQVTLQFDLNRDIDAAAQDVQAAINAAGAALPRNLPYPPIYSKVNPADTPIVTLALTSETVSLRNAERSRRHAAGAAALSEISGVGNVVDAGRHQAGGAHPGRPAAARGLRAVARGHPPGDRQRQCRGPEGRVRRRVPVLHHRGERPARRRRSLPHAGHRLSQPAIP